MAKLIKAGQAPKLYMCSDAYVKMGSLIKECTDEIGWFGTVEQIEDGFVIKDIFVSPQTVTGSTVTSDEEEERKWRETLDDDTYNSLRFHGHSHVNMGVTPSTVDERYRSEIIANIPKDGFFIFLIGNKRGELNIEVYDLKENIVYDEKDCPLKLVTSDGIPVDDYVAKSMKNVKKNKVTTFSGYTGYGTTKKDDKEDWAGGSKKKAPGYKEGSYASGWDDESWYDRYKDPYRGR